MSFSEYEISKMYIPSFPRKLVRMQNEKEVGVRENEIYQRKEVKGILMMMMMMVMTGVLSG